MMMTDKQQIRDRAEQALQSLRPYLQNDGGDVEIVDITEEGVLRLRLLGACERCPQSYMTMQAGIEQAIIRSVPEIRSVVAVEDAMEEAEG